MNFSAIKRVIGVTKTEEKAATPKEANQENGEMRADAMALFDETVNTTEFSLDDWLYTNSLTISRDTTDLSHIIPRRWEYQLFAITIKALQPMDSEVFLDIHIATTRGEYKVNVMGKKRILAAGEIPARYLSSIIETAQLDGKTPIDLCLSGEWRGSFADLETHKLSVRVWSIKPNKLNRLDGLIDIPLSSIVNSDSTTKLVLYKLGMGGKIASYRIEFDLHFQEVYNFELIICDWSVTLPESKQALGPMRLVVTGYKKLSRFKMKSKYSKNSNWDKSLRCRCQTTSSKLAHSSLLVSLETKSNIVASKMVHLNQVLTTNKLFVRFMSDDQPIILTAQLILKKQPTYHQRSQFFFYDSRAFSRENVFIIELESIDRIVTRDGRNTVNLQVAVSVGGHTRLSKVRPQYEGGPLSELVLVMTGENRMEATKIYLDLWAVDEYSNEHLGNVTITCLELLYDNDGNRRAGKPLNIRDTNALSMIPVLAYGDKFIRKVAQEIDNSGSVTITFSAYVSTAQPNLSRTEPLPATAIIQAIDKGEKTALTFRKSFSSENATHAITARGDRIPLFGFITQIAYPKDVTSLFSVFEYVRSIKTSKEYADDVIEDPSISIVGRQSSLSGKAFLLATIFSSMNQIAMCIRVQVFGEKYEWMVIQQVDNDGIQLWDIKTGAVFRMDNRFKRDIEDPGDLAFADDGPLNPDDLPPVRSMTSKIGAQLGSYTCDILVSQNNVYVNLNERTHLSRLYLNPENASRWKPIYDEDFVTTYLTYTQPIVPVYAHKPTEQRIAHMTQALELRLSNDITVLRGARSLKVIWNTDPRLSSFLETGINLRKEHRTTEFVDIATKERAIADWNGILAMKIPPGWSLNISFYKIENMPIEDVSSEVIKNCSFLFNSSKLCVFAVHTAYYFFYGNIAQIYSCILCCSRTSVSINPTVLENNSCAKVIASMIKLRMDHKETVKTRAVRDNEILCILNRSLSSAFETANLTSQAGGSKQLATQFSIQYQYDDEEPSTENLIGKTSSLEQTPGRVQSDSFSSQRSHYQAKGASSIALAESRSSVSAAVCTPNEHDVATEDSSGSRIQLTHEAAQSGFFESSTFQDDWTAIYNTVKAKDPSLFDRLYKYYLQAGYDEEMANYFAAYYTVLKIESDKKSEQ